MTKETNSLIDRLLTPDYWIASTGDGLESMNGTPVEAAAELRRQSAECEALREALTRIAGHKFSYTSVTEIADQLFEWQQLARTTLQQTNKESDRG